MGEVSTSSSPALVSADGLTRRDFLETSGALALGATVIAASLQQEALAQLPTPPPGVQIKVPITNSSNSVFQGTASYDATTRQFGVYENGYSTAVSVTTYSGAGDDPNTQLWRGSSCELVVSTSFTTGSAYCANYTGGATVHPEEPPVLD